MCGHRIRIIWTLLCVATVASFFSLRVGQAQEPVANRTGIELVGRTEKDEAPASWFVVDVGSQERVAEVKREWGVAEVPPGEYQIRILPRGLEALEVTYTTVKVADGQVTKVVVQSGIELLPRAENEQPLDWWYVHDTNTQQLVAKVYRDWGFTPLPPGDYSITLLPRGFEALEILWKEVTVAADQTTSATVDSGIELIAPAKDEATLEKWKVFEAKSGKLVAQVYRDWGFTPLPAGDYRLALLPQGYEALEIPWGDVKVPAATATRVEIKSGIELRPRTPEEDTLEWCFVQDASSNQQVARMYRRWGFTPLPPGNYRVSVQPRGHMAVELAWSPITVAAGERVPVDINSGVELVGRNAEEPELEKWTVVDLNRQQPAAVVSNRWGFTPLPPGRYSVSLLPKDYQAVEIPWQEIEVQAGEVLTIAIQSGVELLPRMEQETPLESWAVIDSQSKKKVAYVPRRWGFTPLPPGEYRLSILPREFEAVELEWGSFTIEEEQATTLKLDSGIELVPRVENEKARDWSVYEKESNKQVANVRERWGFVALPPGQYVVAKMPLRVTDVNVAAGQVTRLQEPELPERWASVTGAGRERERDRDPEEYKKLEEQIELAIRRGAAWLKQQNDVVQLEPRDDYPTIGILALVHAGEFERDPELAKRCTDYLQRRSLNTNFGTYGTSLTAMALRDISARRHQARLFECARWLVENQGASDSHHVWGYGDKIPGIGEEKPAAEPSSRRTARPGSNRKFKVVRQALLAAPDEYWDNSNSQFAVLGLHSAALARIEIPTETWQRIEQHFRETQSDDGAWGYTTKDSSPTGSMTCAGIASLAVARYHLGAEATSIDPAILKGLEWLAWHFTVDENPFSRSDHYYFLYGLERVGVLAGTEFLGEHEWYPTGARYLLANQNDDGSWKSAVGAATGRDSRYLDTCYAILFLRRATLPLQPVEPGLLSVQSPGAGLPAALMPEVELIFDSSGSMAEKLEGTPKIQVSREVMREVLTKLPPTLQVGLRLYGHWGVWLPRRENPQAPKLDPQDPQLNTDSELVVPIGPLAKQQQQQIQKWIDWAQPRGRTPLVYSLLQAKNDFSNRKVPKTVVLVSDGEETCGGKLEDVAAAYQNSDINVVIHVIGFDIQGSESQQQLAEIARLGGGRYYGARSAQELAAALRSAVQTLGFEVFDEAGANRITQGAVNADPVELNPGRYQIRLIGISSEPMIVEVGSGQELSLLVDDSGELRSQ